MASEEARAMLDALMGSDRNAPLPKGAAIPGRKRNLDDLDEYQQMMKRKKSCYDKDIDPIYTAWGVDVYDLFINTKSDIGTNPYIVDKGAHEEYMNLPPQEQGMLGYEHTLFHKLSDLVRQGDRMIARNKEKLKQELNKKLSQRNYQDFVQDVDATAVEQVARAIITLEDMVADYDAKVESLQSITEIESDRKGKLERLLDANRVKSNVSGSDDHLENPNEENDSSEQSKIKIEVPEQDDKDKTAPIEEEDKAIDSEETLKDSEPVMNADQGEMDTLQTELGQLTLQKQRLVYDIAQLISLIVPQNDAVESQRRHLNYVKSDISTDKTVCEISGNNMSSRDADERIAAHYSGKQYVGWKLVRDKLQSMIKKYGRNGPPPPPQQQNRSNDSTAGSRPPMAQQHSSSSMGSHGSSSGGGRGPYPGGGGSGGGGGRDYSGRDSYRGGGNDGGGRDTWTRHGPGGPRGAGGGGGYNHDRRNPPVDDRRWRR
jgi:LUC7 N_terminus